MANINKQVRSRSSIMELAIKECKQLHDELQKLQAENEELRLQNSALREYADTVKELKFCHGCSCKMFS